MDENIDEYDVIIDERENDIESLYQHVKELDGTRHFQSDDGHTMLLSPDLIHVFIDDQGEKEVKFLDLSHPLMPTWYREEALEANKLLVEKQKQTIKDLEDKIQKASEPDLEKQERINARIVKCNKKLESAEGEKKEKLLKRLESLKEQLLISSGHNPAYVERLTKSLDRTKKFLEKNEKAVELLSKH